MNGTFGRNILVLFFTNAIVSATATFVIAVVQKSLTEQFMNCTFLTCAVVQLLYYCYFGHQLTTEVLT